MDTSTAHLARSALPLLAGPFILVLVLLAVLILRRFELALALLVLLAPMRAARLLICVRVRTLRRRGRRIEVEGRGGVVWGVGLAVDELGVGEVRVDVLEDFVLDV